MVHATRNAHAQSLRGDRKSISAGSNVRHSGQWVSQEKTKTKKTRRAAWRHRHAQSVERLMDGLITQL